MRESSSLGSQVPCNLGVVAPVRVPSMGQIDLSKVQASYYILESRSRHLRSLLQSQNYGVPCEKKNHYSWISNSLC